MTTTLTAVPPLTRPIGAHATGTSSAAVRLIEDREVCWLDLVGDESGALDQAATSIAARGAEEGWRCGLPIVVRFNTTSSHPTDGIAALDGWGRLARALSNASGVVPSVGIIDGPVASGLALIVGLLDVVIMIEQSSLYISGPAAVSAMTGRQVRADQLGGTAAHTLTSGVAHLVSPDLDDAISLVGELLSFLPSNNAEPVPAVPAADPPERLCDDIAALVPDDPRAGYDIRDVVATVLDDHDLFELRGGFGRAMLCGLGRLGGIPVGVVANQPAHLAGAIDIPASQKAARFVQWCDALGLPIVTFVDTPGYLPGRDLEWEGMIRHGGQLAFAYAEASVPRLCVILRKAYGGAYIVMDCKAMGNDLCVAWPAAEIAVMGAAGAVQILESRRLGALSPADAELERLRIEADYAEHHLNPHRAAERGDVDAVIEPPSTRAVLCAALPSLMGKRSAPPACKHRNGPL